MSKITSIILLLYISLISFSFSKRTFVTISLIETKPTTYSIPKIEDLSTFYVTGEIDNSKKYLLISQSISGIKNDHKRTPYFFVTKNQNFEEGTDEYDYTSIIESKYGNKMAIPSEYFNSKDTEGFYLDIKCLDGCADLSIEFSYVDEIKLQIDEKFQFYAKDQTVEDFPIRLIGSPDNQDVALILSGGDENQISMTINNGKDDSVKIGKYLPNVLGYKKSVKDGKDTEIKIKVAKNIRFVFQSQFIQPLDYEDQYVDHQVYLDEYDGYFYLIKGREECFELESFGIKKEQQLNEITAISKASFELSFFQNDGNLQTITNKYSEDNQFTAIQNPYFTEQVNNICIKLLKDDQALVQVSIHDGIQSKKVEEPLMDSVSYGYFIDGIGGFIPNANIKVHTLNKFFDPSNKDIFQGVNVGIEIISGNLKIYKTVCKTFPFCKYDAEIINEAKKTEDIYSDFQTLFPINHYADLTIEPSKDYHAMSNFQNVFILVCEEKSDTSGLSGCVYSITYHNIRESKPLLDQTKIIKFINGKDDTNKNQEQPSDKYDLFLHQGQKLVVDLIIYSGDAYIVPSFPKDECTFEEHHLGSNERRIFSCNNIDEIETYLKYSFKIMASEGGAVYYLYIQEKPKNDLIDIWPAQMTTMESIHEKPRNLIINNLEISPIGSTIYSNYLTFFTTINCDLKIKNLVTNKEYSTEDTDLISDLFSIDKDKNYNISYSISKAFSSHADEKNCLYYISSFCPENEESFLTLPEAKPFRIKLNKNIKVVRAIFPYASTSQNPKVYLRVTLSNEILLKILVKVGYSEEVEHVIFQSKDILIIDGKFKGLKMNSLTPIYIVAEYWEADQSEEVVIDFNIKTTFKVPYSIISEKFISDIVNRDSTQYYLSLMSQSSRGEVLVNFRRGTGKIYGRLINSKDTKEKGGWKNRIILPNEKTKYLLEYNSYEQKLKISEKDTEMCEDYCYLIFGIKPNEYDQEFSEEFTTTYKLFYQYQNQDEFSNNYITIPNNEFIFNSLSDGANDFYRYTIYTDSDNVLIDFKSDYCLLTLAFNTKDFSKEGKTKQFTSYGNNQLIKIPKSEILSYYYSDIEDLTSIKGLTFYIKISKRFTDENINISRLDMKYKLRINSPILSMTEIITVDTGNPVYCDNSKEEGFCDYLLKLDSYDKFSTVEMVGVSSGHDNLFIYCNIMDTNEFTARMTQGTVPDWPTKDKYSFPTKEHDPQNFLKITPADFSIDSNIDKRLLIRIYSSGKSPMELITSLFNFQNKIAPFPKEYQLLSADIHEGLQIIMPSDNSYNVHLITISGKGLITLNNEKNYTLYGDYNTLILNLDPHKENVFDIKGEQYTIEEDYDSNFRCFLWFVKDVYMENMERISPGSGSSIAYQNKDIPLGYYIKVIDDSNDLPFNIDLKDLKSNKDFYENWKTNATETFYIKGYLVTEELLLKIQTGQKIKSFDSPFVGVYDYTHHQGNIIIPAEELQKFKKQNDKSSIYVLITVEKGSLNRREYVYIEGSVTSYAANDLKRSTPTDTYITNYFKGGNTKTVSHIYKLDGLALTDETFRKMKIEFATISKNVKVKIIKDPSTGHEERTYFDIVDSIYNDTIGKDIYVVRQHVAEPYLLIECPPTPYDVEYTFKYSSTVKDLFDYKYNNTIEYEKLSESNTKVNLTINKVNLDPDGTIVDCNYYIRIFEIKNELGDLEASSAFRRQIPHSVYKINYDDDLLKGDQESFMVEVHVDLFSKYYIDVVAEIIEDNQFVAYKRFYPTVKEKEKKDINKGKSFENNTVYLIIGISFLLLVLIIGLIGVTYFYRNKNRDLEKKVEEISFKLSQSQNKDYLVGDDVDNNNVLA